MVGYARRPEWLKPSPLDHTVLGRMGRLMRGLNLHTVCESAQCPNRTECFRRATATFMILGDTCTRNCTFCAVKRGKPLAPDPWESEHIVEAIGKLQLRYVVITSVTRDDLPDGGAYQFARAIKAIYDYNVHASVEVLIPDFGGSPATLQTVIDVRPTVLNHNVETVPRLYPEVRPEANYQRSLEILKRAKLLNNGLLTKSGLMLGLGESQREVIEVMADLRQAGCDILTIGQYLQPSTRHHKVVRYAPPQEFKDYRSTGEKIGFLSVISGPLVRSSFHAAETHQSVVELAALTARIPHSSRYQVTPH